MFGEKAAIAAVFGQPKTNRAIQLKGAGAIIAVPSADDAMRIAGQTKALAAELAMLEYDPGFIWNFLGYSIDDLIAIRFQPTAAFDQSPGPSAGSALHPRPAT